MERDLEQLGFQSFIEHKHNAGLKPVQLEDHANERQMGIQQASTFPETFSRPNMKLLLYHILMASTSCPV